MNSNSLNHVGGVALIFGPLLALVFFLLQPGGLLIDSADMTDSIASINALASNTGLTNLTSLVIALGLVMMAGGLYALQCGTRSGGGGDALSRFGLLVIIVGIFGWITAQGLHLVLADTNLLDAGSIADMVPVYSINVGITLMSAIAVSLGLLMFSLALSTRDDFSKIGMLVIAAVSVVALVSFIIAATMPDLVETAMMIGRACYFPWTIWSVALGLNLLKRHA